jgi:hypothetical protein
MNHLLVSLALAALCGAAFLGIFLKALANDREARRAAVEPGED